jgi:UBX domain-containing protein 1/4
MPFGITYEDDLGDYLHTFNIRAFPTYAVFQQGKEVQRIEGVNMNGIRDMVQAIGGSSSSKMPETGGTALGGAGAAAAVSPEEARRLRLAKLDAASKNVAAVVPAAQPTTTTSPTKEEKIVVEVADAPTPMETTAEPAGAAAAEDKDTEMTDADAQCVPVEEQVSALDKLDKEALQTLTESMGFTLLRAQKGLLYSPAGTVESAVEWLMTHQDDADIDEAIPDEMLKSGGKIAQSYKCNECGKVLSNMANLELHANKTGHSDFEESTVLVTPLTAEEKLAKIAEIKELLKAKRAEREEEEKVDQVEREKQRRFMGKEMAKTKEEMDAEQRKRDVMLRQREKDAFKRERARIKAELEKDKRERMANKGKLSSRLGVDGYNPDGIQYDLEVPTDKSGADGGEPATKKAAITPSSNTSAPSTAKLDEYIQKVSSYRAGGDGGKALKVLKAYVGNVVDQPTEVKFRTINMENKAYKTKVKPFIGAKHLLLAVGFTPKQGDATVLVLPDNVDPQILAVAKSKLEAAIVAFG